MMQPSFQGLSRREARQRLKQRGPNEVVQTKKTSGIMCFLYRFRNPLVLVLLFAAIVSGMTGDRVSATIIVLIVIASALLDFLNTHKAEKAAEELKKRVAILTDVIREGKVLEIPVAEVVCGDLVRLKPGDIIPADGKVLQTDDFFTNESVLTGESFPVEKMVAAEVFMGSSAVSGSAIIEITATGRGTKFSAIAESLTKQESPTEFDRNISAFSLFIIKMTFVLVLFVFFVNTFLKHSVLESFLFAVALAVGLTPELLPMIIALNLSKGSLKMAKHGVIVKKLSAIQNLGNMDVLCCDKTGTLTEDRIKLFKYLDGTGAVSERVLLHAYLSSSYHTGFVNPFDSAIRAFRKINISSFHKVDEIPFDFMRRRASMVVEREGKRLMITKGAPEDIFSVCQFYGSKTQLFHGEHATRAHEQYHRLSKEGFRVLGIAVRVVPGAKEQYAKTDEKDLIFLGFIAFLDPPKKSVIETLRLIKMHGIETKIITGDSEMVTKKIAEDINLLVKGVLIGREIQEMSSRALAIAIEKTTIFARVNPIQKERIITALQKNGHVVGYLGDGINDAPSLRAADVGISVDNAVDVAKDSAEIILLKKDLHDLINGVIEGRKIFANTLKYLMMALSSNFGNMFSMAGASVLFPFLPMLPVQILLNNLLYDASQFTIPLDRVDAEDVKKPQRMDLRHIKRFLYTFGPLSSVFDFLTFYLLYHVMRLSEHAFQTGWFLESLATQTLVIYVIRTKRLPFFQSKPSPYLLASTLLAVFVGWAIALDGLGHFFKFAHLSFATTMGIVTIVVLYLCVTEVVKQWFYKRKS